MLILILRGQSWRRAVAVIAALWTQSALAGGSVTVAPNWKDVVSISRAALSIEVCVEPPLRRGQPIHDQLFDALRKAGADYPHFQPYNIFPRLAVAELAPPADGKTSWNFSLIDPITEDF